MGYSVSTNVLDLTVFLSESFFLVVFYILFTLHAFFENENICRFENISRLELSWFSVQETSAAALSLCG